MHISVFDLFSLGIGPSSSHTVGPMRASNDFIKKIKSEIGRVHRIEIKLYGSLALTGKGHGTDKAVINGLAGFFPETVDPESMVPRMHAIAKTGKIILDQTHEINFDINKDLLFLQKELLPKHSNGMKFTAYDNKGNIINQEIYYSVGGGFIVTDESFDKPGVDKPNPPYPFETASDLLMHCKNNNLKIRDIMLLNELTWRNQPDIYNKILQIANIMHECIDNGCKNTGILPGGLMVKRRAPDLFIKLQNNEGVASIFEESDVMNKLNLYAIAVNEENAAGGRIITAPTNGAAGIIPACLRYLKESHHKDTVEDIVTFFLTAAAIGILYKKGASISGAEVGCQGEVGVASSMAAAGIAAVLGGTTEQIENAAEIAMEHHLGMTCDPVMGLVQIPCIERNAMGAVKAVNAARMSLMGTGEHHISLDKVIKTMKQTGHDMQTIYKETSMGGLAVNMPEC